MKCHVLSIQSSVNGHLGGSHFKVANMNNAAGITMNKFLDGRIFILLHIYLGVKLPSHMVTLTF